MVLKYLNEDELFKIAVNLEKEGCEFYTRAAASSMVSAAKEVFKFLAGEEAGHLEYFRKLDAQLDGIGLRPGEIDEEVSMYLRSLVDTGIFKKRFSEKQWADFTDGEALEFGIRAEKNSILFYHGIRDISTNEAARQGVGKIIDEERRHLVRLTTHWKDLR